MDYFLFTGLLGAGILIFGVNFYAWMKAKNGGHAHFPFEKVVIPVALDLFVCWIFGGTNLCECKEVFILN